MIKARWKKKIEYIKDREKNTIRVRDGYYYKKILKELLGSEDKDG